MAERFIEVDSVERLQSDLATAKAERDEVRGSLETAREMVNHLLAVNDAAEASLQTARERIEELAGTFDYIATMLRGDTERAQIAMYIEDDILPSLTPPAPKEEG